MALHGLKTVEYPCHSVGIGRKIIIRNGSGRLTIFPFPLTWLAE